MREWWRELVLPFAGDGRVVARAFAELVARYGHNGRFYHNLHHIQAVLKQIQPFLPQAQNPVALQLAAWFHDVVYDATRHDNEAQSARYAQAVLAKLGLPEALICEVERLIMLTATHETTASTRATTASTRATTATTRATTATTRATTASTRATTASTRATTASTRATTASTRATTASTRATTATTCATTASTRATTASTSAVNAASDIDGQILIDADLAILAADAEQYDAYARAIRQEYAHVADEAYRAGRVQVLRRLGERPFLYYLPEHHNWEAVARANLAREVGYLFGEKSV